MNSFFHFPALPDIGIVTGRLRHFHSKEKRFAEQQTAGRLQHRCNRHPEAPCSAGIP